MSLNDCRGSAHAFHALMKLAQAEIDRGDRQGVTVIYRKPHPAKTAISWMKRRVLRGEFRKQA